MRRLLRILINTTTVLSLVLCAATMAAWVRSYRTADVFWWWNPRMQLVIGPYRGGLFAVFTPYGPLGPLGRGTPQTETLPPSGASWKQSVPKSYDESRGARGTFLNRFGFALEEFHSGAYVQRRLACPYWFILLLTAILPAARLAGWRRRARRLRMGARLCQHCGYDCRATPDRCPECGTAR